MELLSGLPKIFPRSPKNLPKMFPKSLFRHFGGLLGDFLGKESLKISLFYSPNFTTLLLYFVFAKIDLSHDIFYFILLPLSTLPKKRDPLLPSPLPSSPHNLPIFSTSRRKENTAKGKRKKRTTAAIWCLPASSSSPPSPHLFSGKCSEIQCL